MTCSTLRYRGWVLSRTDRTFHGWADRPPMAFIMTSAGAKANNGSATRGSVFSILGVVQHLYWTGNQQCDGRSHFSAQQAALPYRCLSGPVPRQNAIRL